MAIDDNTSYELTGYQVKDLAGRIRRKADASAIPTVNDATLTLVQNGTTVGTFTANQSTDTTINLTGDDSSYSTSEVKTNATWIDGKPIYKKTIDCGALPNATGKSIAHGIANFGELVKLEGGATYPGYNYMPLPYPDQTTAGVVGVILNPTNVYIFAGNNRSNYTKSYVTLWYTKTTD